MEMKWFKASKTTDKTGDKLDKLAKQIVKIAGLTDPDVKQFPDTVEEAAKKLKEKVLIPEPDPNGMNGFDEELDLIAARYLLADTGIAPIESPFDLGAKYSQVKAFLEYVDGILHKGWRIRVVANVHGDDGKIKKVRKQRTRVYPRRTQAGWEAREIILHSKQEIYTPVS